MDINDLNFDKMFDQDKNENPLELYGRNLTKEAEEGKIDPIIGRDDEIRRVIRILSRKTKNNPMLVGEPGVGKTAIVEGLARRIVSGQVPENIKNKQVYEIDVPSMIAGASFQGQFEKRVKSLLKKIRDSKGKIILFIDEFHMLVGTGKNQQGGMDAAQILKPMLARGELKMIGATTLNEYRKYVEKDPALERRMQRILVEEPSEKETITILRGIKERFESFHGVQISDEALVDATKLSSRYISDRFLPDKAIDLIDEAAATIQTEIHSKPEALEKKQQELTILHMEKAALADDKAKNRARLDEIDREIKKLAQEEKKLNKSWKGETDRIRKVANLKDALENLKTNQQTAISEANYEEASKINYVEIPKIEAQIKNMEEDFKSDSKLVKERVEKDDIANIVSKWTGIPVSKLIETQVQKLINLKEKLSSNIKGQDHALEFVANAILRGRADINDPNRPIGSFMFLGPTGVGKTEVARKLALELFDSEKQMVRIDMSEYMEKHSVSRFLGAPPGYVGYDEGGFLTEAIRKKPYSIVLFDEVEKAHPDVINVLLQILEDGQVTDSKGKLINFKNTIIIMTSNIGGLDVLEGKDHESIKNKKLIKAFKPEFLNRIDEIVVFNSLSEKSLTEIVKLEVNKVLNRLSEKGYNITVNPNLFDHIIIKSYDPFYGARSLKGFIKRNIESLIAKWIINNEIEKEKFYELALNNDEKIMLNSKVLN